MAAFPPLPRSRRHDFSSLLCHLDAALSSAAAPAAPSTVHHSAATSCRRALPSATDSTHSALGQSASFSREGMVTENPSSYGSRRSRADAATRRILMSWRVSATTSPSHDRLPRPGSYPAAFAPMRKKSLPAGDPRLAGNAPCFAVNDPRKSSWESNYTGNRHDSTPSAALAFRLRPRDWPAQLNRIRRNRAALGRSPGYRGSNGRDPVAGLDVTFRSAR